MTALYGLEALMMFGASADLLCFKSVVTMQIVFCPCWQQNRVACQRAQPRSRNAPGRPVALVRGSSQDKVVNFVNLAIPAERKTRKSDFRGHHDGLKNFSSGF